MSRDVKYAEAADWSDEEAQANLEYLESRGRIWELDQAKAIRAGEAVPGDAPPEEAAQSDTVPEGTVQEVLDWVGDDKERAGQALDAELEKDEPRSTLVAQLETLTEAE